MINCLYALNIWLISGKDHCGTRHTELTSTKNLHAPLCIETSSVCEREISVFSLLQSANKG